MNLQSEEQLAEHIFVGLDVGGTKTAVLIIDQDSNVLSRHTARTQVETPQHLISGTAAAIEAALDLAGETPDHIKAIGAGFPGHVVPETGEVHMAVNLNLSSYPVGPELSARFSVPVALENDVRAATLGAYEWLRSQRDLSYMAYMSIGTGISAGVVLNRALYRGATGVAVEIGHVPFEEGGPLCACGLHGCLEALAAGPAISRQYKEKYPALAAQSVTTKEIYQAAAAGQPEATALIQQVSQTLARAAYMLVIMYDVEAVVFGGGVSGAGPAFLNPILASIADMRRTSALARKMLTKEFLVALPPGHSAATWGAVKLAQQITTD